MKGYDQVWISFQSLSGLICAERLWPCVPITGDHVDIGTGWVDGKATEHLFGTVERVSWSSVRSGAPQATVYVRQQRRRTK